MSTIYESQKRYIELLVQQGCNVQPGQQVLVFSEPSGLPLIELAAEACYRRGARYVDYDVSMPRVDRLHLLTAPPSRLGFVPTYKTVQIDQIVDSQGAVLAFRSQDEPDLYSDLDAAQQLKLNEMNVSRRDAIKRYREEGVMLRQIAWCLAGPPSPNWARKVFPELPVEEAVEALWRDIFKMTFADQENCLQLWSDHLDRLGHRAQKLNERKVKQLRFVNPSNGTDLTVALSPRSRWVSGRKETANGTPVCLNIPTYEVFTTPDWRGTEGVVACTRPVMVNGSLVENLRLTFKNGELVQSEATANLNAYQAMIGTDEGSKRLGEVALVGVDSPIFQSGRVYQHTLYDENAACHIATGIGYTAAIEDGDRLTPEQMEEIGYNRKSKTHSDVMISDEHTTVYADGQPILVDGKWVEL